MTRAEYEAFHLWSVGAELEFPRLAAGLAQARRYLQPRVVETRVPVITADEWTTARVTADNPYINALR